MHILDLEARAGIQDRETFWMQFAHLPGGFEIGLSKLRELAGERIEPGSLTAPMPVHGDLSSAIALFGIAAINVLAAGLIAGRALL